MSEQARALIELVDRGWGDLSADERRAFQSWLLRANGFDLFLLLLHARGVWRRPRRSSSQTFHAIAETTAPEGEKDD